MTSDTIRTSLRRAAASPASSALAYLAGYAADLAADAGPSDADDCRAAVEGGLLSHLRTLHAAAERVIDWVGGGPDPAFDPPPAPDPECHPVPAPDPPSPTHGCWTTSDDPNEDQQATLVLDPDHARTLLAARRLCPFGYASVREVVFEAARPRVRFGVGLFPDDGDFNEWVPLAEVARLPPEGSAPTVLDVPVLLVLDRQGARYRYEDNRHGPVDTRVLDWPTVSEAAGVSTPAEGCDPLIRTPMEFL